MTLNYITNNKKKGGNMELEAAKMISGLGAIALAGAGVGGLIFGNYLSGAMRNHRSSKTISNLLLGFALAEQ